MDRTAKQKAPAPSTASRAFQNTNQSANSTAASKRGLSKSTATHHQYMRVIAALRSGPKNTIELRRLGVMMPAARIKELNDKLGYQIPTINLVTVYDAEGFAHPRVAVYELVSSPGV